MEEDRGIDSNGIAKQRISIDFYIAEMKAELTNITAKMQSLRQYYKGAGSDSILTSYNQLRSDYPVMYSKLTNYSNRLGDVTKGYEAEDERISSN